MLKSEVLLFISLFFLSLTASAQESTDILNLMNGMTFKGTITDTANGKVLMDVIKKSKSKKLEFEHYRVFPIKRKMKAKLFFIRKIQRLEIF